MNAKALSFVLAAALGAAGPLSGCSESAIAFRQTFGEAWSNGPDPDKFPLDPKLRYLRVTREGRVALLVLGYVDPHPNGPVEVWYSADREALRLQNGRLAGVSGAAQEWRAVWLPRLPPWSAAARAPQPLAWERVRDAMPGYRYGLHDALSLAAAAAPGASDLRGLDPRRLAWFEERSLAGTPEPLPPARYAVDGDTAVYGEQCLAPRWCLSWQRWPAGS